MKKLYLFTDNYPYGSGETFVEPQLHYLSKRFDIVVIPRFVTKGEMRTLPEGVSCVCVARSARLMEKIRFTMNFFIRRIGHEEIATILRGKKYIRERLKNSLRAYFAAELFWVSLKEHGVVAQPENTVYYSFWYTPAALALSFHRDELPGAKVVVRTNGYDLYNERATAGRQPFKPAADAGFDMVIASCRYGQDYYRNTFGFQQGVKYIYSALGCVDHGSLAQPGGDEFHLVSCSGAVSIKRIERIIQGLSHLQNVPIHWTHIGDGAQFSELKNMAEETLKSCENIRLEFVGNLANEAVMDFYSSKPVDCFITTSASEGGCPVSIQEAMSYGIPIIGTAVGGITEMLTDSENILLSADPDGEEVAAALRSMYAMDAERKKALRQFNRSRWEARYDAAKNARGLIEQIDSLWEET